MAKTTTVVTQWVVLELRLLYHAYMCSLQVGPSKLLGKAIASMESAEVSCALVPLAITFLEVIAI